MLFTCNGGRIKGTQSLCLGAGMECPARVEGEIPPSQVMGYRHLILGITRRGAPGRKMQLIFDFYFCFFIPVFIFHGDFFITEEGRCFLKNE